MGENGFFADDEVLLAFDHGLFEGGDAGLGEGDGLLARGDFGGGGGELRGAFLVGLDRVAGLLLDLFEGLGLGVHAGLLRGETDVGGFELGLAGGEIGLDLVAGFFRAIDLGSGLGKGGTGGLELGAAGLELLMLGGEASLAFGEGGAGGLELGADGIQGLLGGREDAFALGKVEELGLGVGFGGGAAVGFLLELDREAVALGAEGLDLLGGGGGPEGKGCGGDGRAGFAGEEQRHLMPAVLGDDGGVAIEPGLEQLGGAGEKGAEIQRRVEKVADAEADGSDDDVHLGLGAEEEDGGGALMTADVFGEAERLLAEFRAIVDHEVELFGFQRGLEIGRVGDVAGVETGFHRDVGLGLENVGTGANEEYFRGHGGKGLRFRKRLARGIETQGDCKITGNVKGARKCSPNVKIAGKKH